MSAQTATGAAVATKQLAERAEDSCRHDRSLGQLVLAAPRIARRASVSDDLRQTPARRAMLGCADYEPPGASIVSARLFGAFCDRFVAAAAPAASGTLVAVAGGFT